MYVKPATPPVMNTRYYGLRVPKSSKHRVMAVCPECGKHVSLGRLQQHGKVHEPGVDEVLVGLNPSNYKE